ncbi:MAG: hypothetical protein M1476_07135 [Candidatus Thermoplasmatota archaeon]|nr:hypothetical protein [Candidatus Thermoplasmatota archaeon]
MALFLILLAVASSVAMLHMIAPDHWLPLSVISSGRGYSRRKKYALSTALGFGHAGTSILVAGAVFYLGLTLIHIYISYLVLAGQILLIIVGLYFIINGYREGSRDTSIPENSALSVGIFPDLALIPILITGYSLSTYDIVTILLAFALLSTLFLCLMIFLAARGMGKIIAKMPPKYMDYLIGAVLILTAVMIEFV